MIEGNRLTQEQVSKVIEASQHFPGRGRDEKEVLGYYAALEKVERMAAARTPCQSICTEARASASDLLIWRPTEARASASAFVNFAPESS